MRVGILALFALCACVGSYAKEIEDTRAGLVGLTGRELRRCLGAPAEVEILDRVEQQTYRFTPQHDPWVSVQSGSGSGPTIGTHTVPAPGTFGSDAGRDSPAYCQLDFELRDGRVAQVRSEGRDEQGMNASGSCLLAARRCLPDEDQ